jgi:hypothetical protein
MESIWIAVLYISQATATKIAGKHDMTVVEVRDAVVCVSGLPFRWDDHPERGLRAVVTTTVRDFEVALVLYPAGDDTWNLGSVYRVS